VDYLLARSCRLYRCVGLQPRPHAFKCGFPTTWENLPSIILIDDTKTINYEIQFSGRDRFPVCLFLISGHFSCNQPTADAAVMPRASISLGFSF
jgi:hypothetical protein